MLSQEKKQPLIDAVSEWRETEAAYMRDRDALVKGLNSFRARYDLLPGENRGQHSARRAFDSLANHARGLIKQVDLLYKLAARTAQLATELATDEAAAEFFTTAGLLQGGLNSSTRSVRQPLTS